MKVLYIGHYLENSGWSDAAQGLMRAMDSVDIDVVARNIPISGRAETPEIIKSFENKDIQDVDYCIQHVLPAFVVGTDKFKKNIAYTVLESKPIRTNFYKNKMSLVDEVWVPCEDNAEYFRQSNIKVQTVPHAFDMSKYSKILHRHIDFTKYKDENTYIFYTIADYSSKKNIEELLKTYYATFSYGQNVLLILKVNAPNASEQDIYNQVNAVSEKIKNSLMIHPDGSNYPNILIVGSRLSEDEMISLHNQSHCFVTMSKGEAWSIPSFDAMCFGNRPICPNWGGPKEYITKETGTLVECNEVFCDASDRPLPNIYTGREVWHVPKQIEVARAMEKNYKLGSETEKSSNGLIRGKEFSFTKVGQKIKDLLES
tara:strand:- start:5219 stop:6331 length:1113 start_codon:yes stop_codon:yes gene_type:complete